MKRVIAAGEMVLISPAMLFMTALFVRNLQPQPAEPAHTAQQIVLWYSVRPHLALWVFLMAMPFAVFLIGGAALAANTEELRDLWRSARAHGSMLLIAIITAASAAILAAVALHALSD